MAVEYENLTREKFENMGYRETVKNVPKASLSGTEDLTKTQILTLIMIDNSTTRGFSQIRHYTSGRMGKGVYIPSESVPNTLDEKGYVRVGRKRQVSRRTGRGATGFEKKKEGGYIKSYSSDDVLDDFAQKFGFKNRFDDDFHDFAIELLSEHPNLN